MGILPSRYYRSLKRHWRRRNNQEINSATHNKTKRQISSLRGGRCSPIDSPVNFFAKFHDAYADLMIYLTKKIPNPNSIHGGLLPRVIATGGEISWVSSGYEQFDDKLVLEIYKNSAPSPRNQELNLASPRIEELTV